MHRTGALRFKHETRRGRSTLFGIHDAARLEEKFGVTPSNRNFGRLRMNLAARRRPVVAAYYLVLKIGYRIRFKE
jgi:hypothetical protein